MNTASSRWAEVFTRKIRLCRLNRAYRAIYVGHDAGKVELIEVLEVNKHDY